LKGVYVCNAVTVLLIYSPHVCWAYNNSLLNRTSKPRFPDSQIGVAKKPKMSQCVVSTNVFVLPLIGKIKIFKKIGVKDE